MEITDLAATMEGMALEATMEKWVLEGIKEGMGLEATMVGLVLEEEIVEEEMVSLAVQIAGEVALVLEAI